MKTMRHRGRRREPGWVAARIRLYETSLDAACAANDALWRCVDELQCRLDESIDYKDGNLRSLCAALGIEAKPSQPPQVVITQTAGVAFDGSSAVEKAEEV